MAPLNICVVGSVNLDLNTYTDRLPAPGETVHARNFTTGYGGKGANQAVMAARLGAAVTFVARVGRDSFGRDALEHFRAEGIDTRHVTPTDGVSTGTAVITVDAAGRNTIVVAPGANGLLSAADIEAARSAIESAHVLVCQQEVPAEANLAAMRIASRAGVAVVFNPAPAGSDTPDEAYRLSTVICPNEHEAAVLTGHPTSTLGRSRVGRPGTPEPRGAERCAHARRARVPRGDARGGHGRTGAGGRRGGHHRGRRRLYREPGVLPGPGR